MPPRGRGRGATKATTAAAPAAADVDEQLFQPNSECNAQLAVRIRDALSTITGKDLFFDIVHALPLDITGDLDSGVQAPFQESAYRTAMTTHNTYTCGCNLFWTRFDFSPNPGVPVRMTAIDTLMSFYFSTPSPMPRPVVISIKDKGINPLTQRGILRAISPEEIRCAMLFAIARDIERGAPDGDLSAWRCHVLSTTTQFVYTASHDDEYFAACQLRENMGQDHESMSRTALQRVFEIARFRENQIRVHGPTAGSATAVFKAYERVKTAGNQQPYSLTAIDVALTLMSRMLCIPEVQSRLLNADSWPRGGNPFDSIYKLEVILRKGKDAAGISWLVNMIWHVVGCGGKPPDSEDLSFNGLKGKPSSGNRGYADVVMFKQDSLSFLLDQLPQQLGLDRHWFITVARSALASVDSHNASTKDTSSWLAGINKPTLSYVKFLQDYIYGVSYDACIKALVKNNKQPSNLAFQPGITELLADIKNDMLEMEKQRSHTETDAKADEDTHDGAVGDAYMDVTVTIRSKDSTTEDVKLAQLAESHKESVMRCRQLIEHRVDACITLISKKTDDTPNLSVALGATPAGRYTGPMRVAVIYDTKLHGEAQCKPHHRLPPVQADDVKMMLESARDRHHTTGAHDTGNLPDTDLYFLLDGGRDVMNTLTAFFRGKASTSRQLHIVYEAESILNRYCRVKGFMTHSSLENIKVVAGSFPASLNTPRARKHYKGTTALNVISDVPVPARDEQWCLTWAQKKEILAGSLIPVGGRVSSSGNLGKWDDEDEPPAQARKDSTLEPVFFHSMSPHLWSELFYDFEVGVVIDLTAGDGAAALAALRAGLTYTGVTLSAAHSTELRKYLYMAALQAAATEGDPLYDMDLVLSLRQKSRKRMTLDELDKQAAGDAAKATKPKKAKPDASGTATEGKAVAKAKPKAKAKTKANGKLKAKMAADTDIDPFKDAEGYDDELDPEEDWGGDEDEEEEDDADE